MEGDEWCKNDGTGCGAEYEDCTARKSTSLSEQE
jgi:hypothetical protein